ncbi:unnamed protein product [Staurois parvus]|uniref:Uncharacterized protein n=1 Tax=Staurois parvus TaxID=386267 RepID=A0ABN9CEC1_9NEOB|nr:unnamed protein product [Staurois parvus]
MPVIGDMYTDHQGTDDHCSPSSATCQCPSVPCASAHQCHINATYQCLPVHINYTYQCPSELPFSVTHQCHLSVPVSAVYQCHVSVLPFSAHQ